FRSSLVFGRGPVDGVQLQPPRRDVPALRGLGRVSEIDVEDLIDRSRSLNEGAITVPQFQVGSWYWQTMAYAGFVDPDTKLADFTPQQWQDFLYRPATKVKPGTTNATYEGLVVKVQRIFLSKDRDAVQPHIRA